jgi:hypothetical protein
MFFSQPPPACIGSENKKPQSVHGRFAVSTFQQYQY